MARTAEPTTRRRAGRGAGGTPAPPARAAVAQGPEDRRRRAFRRLRRRGLSVVLRGRRAGFLALEPVAAPGPVEFLGTAYGGWSVVTEGLGSDSVCWCAGAGEDLSFDEALTARFGCRIEAFDPVPRAVRYAERVMAGEPRFRLHPVGLWSDDGSVTFYAPEFEGWISHSAVDFRRTPPAFEAPVRSVPSLMRELGEERIDLPKLSVEGAEYAVLGTICASASRSGSCSSSSPRPSRSRASAERSVSSATPAIGWRRRRCSPGAGSAPSCTRAPGRPGLRAAGRVSGRVS